MERDKAYLQDILTACYRIVTKIEKLTVSDFLLDEDLQDIVMRQITIMGEAARLLSENTKGRFWEIPWHKITGMRHRLVHEYRDIDFEEVWKTATHDIPLLMKQIEKAIVSL